METGSTRGRARGRVVEKGVGREAAWVRRWVARQRGRCVARRAESVLGCRWSLSVGILSCEMPLKQVRVQGSCVVGDAGECIQLLYITSVVSKYSHNKPTSSPQIRKKLTFQRKIQQAQSRFSVLSCGTMISYQIYFFGVLAAADVAARRRVC